MNKTNKESNLNLISEKKIKNITNDVVEINNINKNYLNLLQEFNPKFYSISSINEVVILNVIEYVVNYINNLHNTNFVFTEKKK